MISPQMGGTVTMFKWLVYSCFAHTVALPTILVHVSGWVDGCTSSPERAPEPPGFNRFRLKFSPLSIAGGIWTQRSHYLKERIAEQLELTVNDTVSHAESQTAESSEVFGL